VILTFNI